MDERWQSTVNYHIGKHPTLADEIRQSAALAAWIAERNIDPARGDSESYIRYCVDSACRRVVGEWYYWRYSRHDYRRPRKLRHADYLAETVVDRLTTDDHCEISPLVWRLLTDREALVVSLHVLSGLSLADVGNELGVTKAGAASLYRSAVRKLRKWMTG